MSLGTGGTLSGTSCYLKGIKPDIQVVLADPEGNVGVRLLTRAHVQRRLRIAEQGALQCHV